MIEMSDNFNPLISVVIPAYNAENFIAETLNSVLNQSYKNIEVLIIDDASADKTFDIIQKYAEKDSRIKPFRIDHAGVPSVPRNYGIKKAAGDFIAFVDSDDLWAFNKLEQQIKHFKNNSDAVLLYSMSVTFGEVNIFSPYYEVLPLPFRAAHSTDELLKKGNTIPLSSVLVKTGNLRAVNGFDEDPDMNVGEDYDLWIRLGRIGKIIFIPRIYTYYRIHKQQLSNKWDVNRDKLKYIAEKRNITLPEYKFYREKNIFIRIVRNCVHVFFFIWIKFISLFD